MKFTGGRIPYGFQALGGELVFDSRGTGPKLVTLMRAHRHGHSYRGIAQAIKAQGWEGPGGGEWNYGSVARVIKRGKELSHLIPFEYAIF